MKSISSIHFIDKLIKKNELGQPFSLSDHQREVLRLAFAFAQDGRLPWDTNKTPRDILAQALDHGSWLKTLT